MITILWDYLIGSLQPGHVALLILATLAAGKVGLTVGVREGKAQGVADLKSALENEGYTLMLFQDRPAGSGRIVIVEQRAPF